LACSRLNIVLGLLRQAGRFGQSAENADMTEIDAADRQLDPAKAPAIRRMTARSAAMSA
jgi:hypothetical protein